jgi:hypothetical protein
MRARMSDVPTIEQIGGYGRGMERRGALFPLRAAGSLAAAVSAAGPPATGQGTAMGMRPSSL